MNAAGTTPLPLLMSRRRLLVMFGAAGAATLVGCGSGSSKSSVTTGSSAVATSPTSGTTGASTSGTDPLAFPVDDFTEATMTVTTSAGDRAVTYRLYQHLQYVAKPVDAAYQSLDVKVPVGVDGAAIDAASAPILFIIGVGGYMSVSNAGSGSGGMPGGGPGGSDRAGLALAAGYVVVEPGCRGRDNQATDGTYYGKAPAAIADLKSAVRYVRHNDGIMPGDTTRIVSIGTSAGGALSALLGASGNSPLYDEALTALGAADEDDSIFASADYCPITDLDHADMEYEWMFGAVPVNGQMVDQDLSAQLAALFATYQSGLALQGRNGFGAITSANYGDYLVQEYLVPSANTYLAALSDTDRAAYLAERAWLTWANDTASFSFTDFLAYDGRMKGLPAFDAFDLSSAETVLFGDDTTNARHFTEFSLRQATGDATATIAADLQNVVNMMNPMFFISGGGSDVAAHWWIRHGSKDKDTSLPVVVNLATSLENAGKDVNVRLYWDAGHGSDEDPEDFVSWVGKLTA
jgi:acetyl esterase/lipase